ncbi:putative MazG nucleotide pyrophosphohydrolase [Bacillus phage PBC1]|uniref:Putative MazG nucleotide pyrophosphohydrolase n=1 Tax=Bacillus phage PBC1 TaxID=1161901 RepID=I1TLG6_9CAUD|nr:MazG-like pyrophosphatase [Bacillus phage PBC1]AFE86268.1 putative MazG nucleotide pyrophosphohydrolase [Bacillus phage PBC1]
MLPNQYQELSRRTAPKDMPLTNIVMGLVGEGGEIVDLIKKQVYHNHPIDAEFKDKLEKEIGDYLWYKARILDYGGTDFAEKSMSFPYIQKQCAKQVEVSGITNIALLFGFKNGALASRPLNEVEIMYWDVKILMNCICAIAQHYDVSIEQAAINNIIKLSQRYPQGFSSEDSVARIDTK